MKAFLTMWTAVLAIVAGSAAAGPLDEAKARERLEAIARGDVPALMRDYAGDAVLQWLGGRFDGAYRGEAALRKVWTEFHAAQAPIALTIGEVVSHTNPQGVTVVAKARYRGKLDVRVVHVFVYRDDRLVLEVWQIDPRLEVGG